VGLEQGPLNLVSTTEELLGRKSSGSFLENRDYGCRGFATLTRKTALTSPTSGGQYSSLADQSHRIVVVVVIIMIIIIIIIN
jgi:hypothetical protein